MEAKSEQKAKTGERNCGNWEGHRQGPKEGIVQGRNEQIHKERKNGRKEETKKLGMELKNDCIF